MKRLFAFLLVFCLLLTACGKKTLTWQDYFDEGMTMMGQGRYADAVVAFGSAIAMDPSKGESYIMRGDAYLMEDVPDILLSMEAQEGCYFHSYYINTH